MKISRTITIPEEELEFVAVRAQGPGGQNVNKVSTAIQLFFDIRSSSLPEKYRNRLLKLSDHRITGDGKIIIKAQSFRSQEKNREAARQRLAALIRSVMVEKKKRKPTKPSRAAREKRIETKKRKSRNKALRRPPNPD